MGNGTEGSETMGKGVEVVENVNSCGVIVIESINIIIMSAFASRKLMTCAKLKAIGYIPKASSN